MSIEMASQHSMEWSTDKLKILAALFAFQQEITTLPRTKTARVRLRDGGEYEYKYADLDDTLEAIKPLLAKYHLVVVQATEVSAANPGSSLMMVTEVIHVDTGEYLRSFMPFTVSDKPQTTGGLISYYRRYHLQVVLGLSTEDPDGNLEGKAAQALAETRNKYVPKVDTLLTKFADETEKPRREEIEDELRETVDELAPWQYAVVWTDLNGHQKAVIRDMLARSRARFHDYEIPQGEKDAAREGKREEQVQKAGKRGKSK